jgi:hypothetical protein
MFRPALLLSGLLASAALHGQELASPDGAITVRLALEGGQLTYGIVRQGHVVLETSPLGLVTSIGSFASGLKAAGSTTARIDERYTLPHGKVRDVHYQANELIARFTNEGGDRLEVIFRASNRDVAFCYRISSEDKRRVIVQREQTGFDLPARATAFVTPQARAGTGWMASKPSYEEPYMVDVPVGTVSQQGLGFTFPALFRLGDDGWMLLSETGVSGAYAGSRLADPTADGLYRLAFPQPEENGGIGEATVHGALPLQTPWRTLTIGADLAPIIETTVATDLVKPLYEPTRDYRGGRATWSWLLWQDQSMNEADQRTFIDLAARMGYEFILIDALWDANLGRARLAELVRYAARRKVGVLLWYNSNGAWNDAPQGPRNLMSSAPARQNEMAWLQAIGVRGLKVDFFGGDKQATMQLYEDILTDANQHGLMLNFHGATLPRGWERMYPNHMTSEAVTASENLVFSQGFADREAFNSTVFPFTRNPVAAMDYGPVLLNPRFSRNPERGNLRRTTDAFQLATAVLYQSPLQHFGVTPEGLKQQPGFVIDFLEKVPVVWDETRFVDGYPGKYIALARRSGGHWYVAASNGGAAPRTLVLSLPQLKGRKVARIHDGGDGRATRDEVLVGDDGMVSITLQPGGGAVWFD